MLDISLLYKNGIKMIGMVDLGTYIIAVGSYGILTMYFDTFLSALFTENLPIYENISKIPPSYVIKHTIKTIVYSSIAPYYMAAIHHLVYSLLYPHTHSNKIALQKYIAQQQQMALQHQRIAQRYTALQYDYYAKLALYDYYKRLAFFITFILALLLIIFLVVRKTASKDDQPKEKSIQN